VAVSGSRADPRVGGLRERAAADTGHNESADQESCIVELGSGAPHQLALYLGLLDVDFEVLDAPEFAAALNKLSDRYRRAAERFNLP